MNSHPFASLVSLRRWSWFVALALAGLLVPLSVSAQTVQGEEEPPVAGPAEVNLQITNLTVTPSGDGVIIVVDVENTGAAAIADVFYVDLYINPPQPVTSGGQDWTTIGTELVPAQGIEWAVTALGAGQSVRLTSLTTSATDIVPQAEYSQWSGQLPAAASDLYAYADSWAQNASTNGLIRETDETDNGFHFTLQANPPPADAGPIYLPIAKFAPSRPPEPEFDASIPFRPLPDGFKFENWGGNAYDESTDLDAGSLIRMFGANNVCRSGSTGADCVLTAAAREWREQNALGGARGGHCYGLALASQRFYGGLDSPSNYQSGISSTYDLDPLPPLRSHLTEMWATQLLALSNGNYPPQIYGSDHSPSAMLNFIRQRFQTHPKDPYVLSFFRNDTEGHAVTPYAIENKGGGVYWLYIYDNNWPNAERYMIFNTNQESWQYNFAALNPGVPLDVWAGDARTGSLYLRAASAVPTSGWRCPFCGGNQTAGAQGEEAAGGGEQVTFELIGEGELLILDPLERAIGYDFEYEQYLNEIEDAEILRTVGGLGVAQSPAYRLPLLPGSVPYTLYVAGGAITETVAADLVMSGPGYVVTLGALDVSPGEDLQMTVSPDGRQVTLNASEEGAFGPDITLALDPDPEGDSYLFEVAGFELAAFRTITVTLDIDNGLLYFEDDDGGSDVYALDVLRIAADGSEYYYTNDGVALDAGDDAAMNFGLWDGEGDMLFTIDGTDQPYDNEYPEP